MQPTYDPIAEYDRWEAMQERSYQRALREDYCKMCKWYDAAPGYDEYEGEIPDGYGLCKELGELIHGQEHPANLDCDCYEY